jgi:hypothetical protein
VLSGKKKERWIRTGGEGLLLETKNLEITHPPLQKTLQRYARGSTTGKSNYLHPDT